jgi:hypothetical protein
MSPPRSRRWNRTPRALEVLDDLESIESRAKKAIELRRYHDVATLEFGEQRTADGAVFDRDRAAHALLDHHLGERETMHHGVAFDAWPSVVTVVAGFEHRLAKSSQAKIAWNGALRLMNLTQFLPSARLRTAHRLPGRLRSR